MKKIVLLCDVFTDMVIANNFLVERMRQTARKIAIECEISVHPVDEMRLRAIDADIILLSPLICYEQVRIERLVNCPVDIISMNAYANVDAKSILNCAIEKMSQAHI